MPPTEPEGGEDRSFESKEYSSVAVLQKLLREQAVNLWNERSCHPGDVTPDYQSVYLEEREAEIRTLTDPRIVRTLAELDLGLASFVDNLTETDRPLSRGFGSPLSLATDR